MKQQELVIVTSQNDGEYACSAVEAVFLADRSLLEEAQTVIADSRAECYDRSGRNAGSFEDILKRNLKREGIVATFLPYVEMPE